MNASGTNTVIPFRLKYQPYRQSIDFFQHDTWLSEENIEVFLDKTRALTKSFSELQQSNSLRPRTFCNFSLQAPGQFAVGARARSAKPPRRIGSLGNAFAFTNKNLHYLMSMRKPPTQLYHIKQLTQPFTVNRLLGSAVNLQKTYIQHSSANPPFYMQVSITYPKQRLLGAVLLSSLAR